MTKNDDLRGINALGEFLKFLGERKEKKSSLAR